MAGVAPWRPAAALLSSFLEGPGRSSPLGRPRGQGCFLRQERCPTTLRGHRAPPEAAGQRGGGGRARAGSPPSAAPRPAALGTAGWKQSPASLWDSQA